MKLRRSTLAGFAAILLWSANVAFTRSISEQIGPVQMGFAVYTAGGLMLAAGILAGGRRFRLPEGRVYQPLIRGFLVVVYLLALSMALGLASGRLEALEIGLLNYLWPSLTLLGSLFLLNKRAGAWLLPGTALALAGIFLVLTQGASVTWASFSAHILSNPLSYALGLLAAVCWAVYSNLTRRWQSTASVWDMPVYLTVGGLVFGLIALFQGQEFSPTIATGVEILLLALFTAGGYMLWDVAMRNGNLVLTAAASYLTPFFSTLVSALYLRVTAGESLWIGCLLIILGSFISWRSFETDGMALDSEEYALTSRLE